ncbi:MAG: hypothetical protein ACLQFW_03985 [Xanthobacteraceae bacterium]
MPIRPFLAGQAFDPEAIHDMSLALENLCEALGLTLRDDPATRLVAAKIIELTQRRVRGVATLGAMTLEVQEPIGPRQTATYTTLPKHMTSLEAMRVCRVV